MRTARAVLTPESAREAHGCSMNFGQAIEVLKRGGHVARTGWNGKNMVLSLVKPCIARREYIELLDAQGCLVPWAPSQTDLFAEDWEEMRELPKPENHDPRERAPFPYAWSQAKPA